MEFTLYVRNLRALRNVEWSPHGVSCLTGPNGSGKTSVILALLTLRRAFRHGISDAIATMWGGGYQLRSRGAADHEPIELGLAISGLEWRLLFASSGRGASLIRETLKRDGDEILALDASGQGHHRGREIRRPDLESSLAWFLRQNTDDDPDLERIADAVLLLSGFHDPDLFGLRLNGSRTTESVALQSRCRNVFAVLKSWRLSRKHAHRFQFVLDGLRAAFPALCHDIDFAEAGQTVVVNTYRPGEETPLPIGSEANGLLALLVQLTAVASARPGSAIAIDEPENALHPFAIREFLRRAEVWSTKHDVTILLTTHSPVILNYFQGRPAHIFVMEPSAPVTPVRLDQRERADWLADFEFGDCYANGDYGAPLASVT